MSDEPSSPGELSGLLPCLLALEDGKTFSGYAFGAAGTAVGEAVFNTSLTGYQEILTDPSYAGQIVALTYPEIGNYGTNEEDVESERLHARGLVVRHLSRNYSSWRAKRSLSDFLKDNGVIGLTGVDTSAITRHIRDKGAMRSAISTEILNEEELSAQARSSPEMTGADLTREVTTSKAYRLGNGGIKVAVIDFGIKRNILNNLVGVGMSLTVFPAETSAEEILAGEPAGLFL